MDRRTAYNAITALADAHTHELGFLPRQTIIALYDAGRIELAETDRDALGYIMRGSFRKRCRIYQTCIRPDARRHTFGSQTLSEVIRQAIAAKVHVISLWCAADLEANEFWLANGFQTLGTRIKSTQKRREQIGYQLELPAGRAHYARLNHDGREPLRSKLIDMLAMQGASEKQLAKFRRDRYA